MTLNTIRGVFKKFFKISKGLVWLTASFFITGCLLKIKAIIGENKTFSLVPKKQKGTLITPGTIHVQW